jgi:hypothetical protein
MFTRNKVCAGLARAGDLEEIQRRYPELCLFANNEHRLIVAPARRNHFTNDPCSSVNSGILIMVNYALVTTDTLGVLDIVKNRSGSTSELADVVMKTLGLSCVRFTEGTDQIRLKLDSEEHTMLRLKGIL